MRSKQLIGCKLDKCRMNQQNSYKAHFKKKYTGSLCIYSAKNAFTTPIKILQGLFYRTCICSYFCFSTEFETHGHIQSLHAHIFVGELKLTESRVMQQLKWI